MNLPFIVLYTFSLYIQRYIISVNTFISSCLAFDSVYDRVNYQFRYVNIRPVYHVISPRPGRELLYVSVKDNIKNTLTERKGDRY